MAGRSATREFAVAESFENVVAMVSPKAGPSGANGSNGSSADFDFALSIEQLQQHREPQAVLGNFLQLVHIAVEADQQNRAVESAEVAAGLAPDPAAIAKLGRLVARAPDVCREGEFAEDFSSWTFLPSYNVHFFRRAHTIDDFLVVEASLIPRAASEGTTTTTPGEGGKGFKVEEGTSLPDGIVTFQDVDLVVAVAQDEVAQDAEAAV